MWCWWLMLVVCCCLIVVCVVRCVCLSDVCLDVIVCRSVLVESWMVWGGLVVVGGVCSRLWNVVWWLGLGWICWWGMVWDWSMGMIFVGCGLGVMLWVNFLWCCVVSLNRVVVLGVMCWYSFWWLVCWVLWVDCFLILGRWFCFLVVCLCVDVWVVLVSCWLLCWFVFLWGFFCSCSWFLLVVLWVLCLVCVGGIVVLGLWRMVVWGSWVLWLWMCGWCVVDWRCCWCWIFCWVCWVWFVCFVWVVVCVWWVLFCFFCVWVVDCWIVCVSVLVCCWVWVVIDLFGLLCVICCVFWLVCRVCEVGRCWVGCCGVWWFWVCWVVLFCCWVLNGVNGVCGNGEMVGSGVELGEMIVVYDGWCFVKWYGVVSSVVCYGVYNNLCLFVVGVLWYGWVL